MNFSLLKELICAKFIVLCLHGLNLPDRHRGFARGLFEPKSNRLVILEGKFWRTIDDVRFSDGHYIMGARLLYCIYWIKLHCACS